MITIAAPILALACFLVGFAWGRRRPSGRWTVEGEDGAYELRCDGRKVATFASYHKAVRAADLHNGDTR